MKNIKNVETAMVLAILGFIVAIIVFALLAQDAITEEIEPICGIPGHEHTADCYPQQEEDPLAGGFMDILGTSGEIDGYTSDLADIIIDPVKITDLLDQTVTNFIFGDDYKISLNFQENSSYQLEYDEDGLLNYQLPSEIKIVEPVSGQPIFSGTTQIGEYSIDTDGYITVKFYDVIESPPSSGVWVPTPDSNFIDNYIDAFFKLEIKVQFMQFGDNVKIDFGNGVEITVNILEEPVDAALSITKGAAPGDVNTANSTVAFDPSINGDWKIHYNSVITATEGTVTDISFHDDAIGYFTLADKSFLESVQVSIKGGPFTDYTLAAGPGAPNTYYWVNASDGTGGFYLVFPSGTELSQGEDITINYVIDDYKLSLARNQDPYHTAYGEVFINNAYASGKDGLGNTLDVNARLTVDVPRHNYTPKSGVLSADGKTIAWTAAVGDGIEPLAGKTIYDNLGDTTQSFLTDVNIKLYKADHTTQLGSDIILTTPTGGGFTYDVTDPAAYYADITYTTKVEDLTAAIYSNTIGVSVNGKNYGDSPYVLNPNTDMKATKSALLTMVDGYKAIKWTINWSVPAIYYGHSMYFWDYLQGGASGFTNTPQHLTVTVNGDVIPADDPANGWFWIRDANNLYWYFYFSPGGVNTGLPWGLYNSFEPRHDEDSLFPFESGADITVTFYTMLEGPNASTLTETAYSVNTYAKAKTGDTLLAAVMDPSIVGYPEDVENMVQYWGYITSEKSGYDFVGVTAPIDKNGFPGGSGRYINYRVTINSLFNHSSNTQTSFDIGDDPVFTDTFDSTILEYAENSFYIMAYPNGVCYFGPYSSSLQDELINGGSISNYIKDNGNGTSTITIHLKDLMQITGPATEYYNYTTDDPWTGPPTGVYTYPYPASSTTPADWWSAQNLWPSQPMIEVFYRLQLKPDAETGEHEVQNEAAINTNWTSSNTSTVGMKVVTKEMQLDDLAGNVMEATIMVNPMAQQLTPDSADGLYVIEDEMNETLAAFLGSLKIEAEVTPGSENWEEKTIDPLWGNAWSIMTTSDNRILFKMPDETSIRITYRVLVKGTVGENVTVKNMIDVLGKYFAQVEQSFQLQSTNATAGGSLVPVTLYKQDASDNVTRLPDAQFDLYMSISYPGLPSPSVPAFNRDGVNFYYVENRTTDENGQIEFSTQYLSYSTGAIYALKETVAPDGYRLPSDPYTFFTLKAQTIPGAFTPETAVIADYITIGNEPYTGGATFKGEKDVLVNSSPTLPDPSTEFRFVLSRLSGDPFVNGPYSPEYAVGGSAYTQTRSVTLADMNITQDGFYAAPFLFDPIEGLKPGDYYYEVKEDLGEDGDAGEYGEKWKCDTSTYIYHLKVYADNIAPDVEACMVLNGDIVQQLCKKALFTNVYEEGGPTLPETGGVGRGVYAILGLSMMASALWRIFIGRRKTVE